MKIIDGAKIELVGTKVKISGAKGTLERDFAHPEIKMELKNGEFLVTGDKAMTNTILAHVKNMAFGVINGYSAKLKMLYSHFPIGVEIKGKDIMIKNFLGEKQPRKARIIGQTKVESKGQEMSISGISKEEVGQTIANIKSATRIRNRDSRVFQDGFYVIDQ
ncbi:MAG: 50S ribosomal protein L6 [Candidatus Micrarchaeota archaeon]|nr:50S ribosomal protein L6 [Candidatus Micrarchaeota archaeon]